jgi:branched-subunit amino acid aminotransferase/4-amino-4-deoxychorismate lyase
MINYNGSLFEKDEKVFNGQNRAFRYGDGLFESIRVIKGKMPFYNYHFERILRGMKILKMNIPTYFNTHYMRHEISKVIEKEPNCRLRIAIWREGAGTYQPNTNSVDFLIEATPLPESKYILNDLGLTIGIYKEYKLRQTLYSSVKTSNALPYIMAGIYAKENMLDDVIMLNTEGPIAEGISSNIFIIKEGTLLTPPLSSGCVGGVMRQVIFTIAQEMDMPCREENISLDMLRSAEEVFYTNAVQGIRWVGYFENIEYPFEKTQRIYERLVFK